MCRAGVLLAVPTLLATGVLPCAREVYRRTEHEGGTLIQTALAAPADIRVADRELRITLAPLNSPHRSRAIDSLCEELNALAVPFPGSPLRMRFAIASDV